MKQIDPREVAGLPSALAAISALQAAAADPPRFEVLMASGTSFPADPLESSEGGDWLYGKA